MVNPSTQVGFVVSPAGDDAHAGTVGSPFATIGRAQRAAREAAVAAGCGEVRVSMRAGRYALAEPLVLTPADVPRQGSVTYAAWPGETVVLSGGSSDLRWRRLDDTPADLPTAAHGRVWVAEVPAGQRFYSLFDAQGLLTRAHSPALATDDRPVKDPTRELAFRPGDLAAWPDLADAELFITPRHSWVVNYLPFESVDESAGIARTALPATYPLVTPPRNRDIQLFYRIENRLAYLNGPGQWVLDSRRGKLYLWPRGDQPEGVIVPRLSEVLRVEGGGDRSPWAKRIRLEGLTFSHCDRMVWGPDRLSLQHDWELLDTPNALVRLRGAEGVEITRCRFAHSGSGGVRLDLHAVDHTIRGNEFADLGGTGIALIGYGPGSRDENHHHTIAHNHIHHVARLWWQQSGIFISQSGHNAIHDNLIHNLPYNGITVSGPRTGIFDRHASFEHEGGRTLRWDELGDLPLEWWAHIGWKHARFNVIEHNEVHHVMETIGDGNGIYLSATGEGNVVRRNYVHDIPGPGTAAAIRNDDEQYFTLVEDNVIWRINAAGIITKNINMVENNIVVDCYGDPKKGFCYISVRHMGPSHGTGVRRNILCRSATGDEPRRPFLEDTHLFSQSAADDNLLWCAVAGDEARQELAGHQARGKCLRSVVADPRFIDLDRGDFHLHPDSPAFDVGFRPIDHWGVRGTPGP